MDTATPHIDDHGARLDVVIQSTPSGPITIELKITCPPSHPTGITTSMLQTITSHQLGRSTNRSAQMDAYLKQLSVPKWSKGSRHTFDKAELKIISDVYNTALHLGVAPTKTIQEWLGSSRPTASRAVKQARDLGLLGSPIKKGLPGNKTKN